MGLQHFLPSSSSASASSLAFSFFGTSSSSLPHDNSKRKRPESNAAHDNTRQATEVSLVSTPALHAEVPNDIAFRAFSSHDEMRVHASWDCPEYSQRVQCTIPAGTKGVNIDILDKHMFRSVSLFASNDSVYLKL